MWIFLICQCKSKKWHNSFPSSWYSVSPSFLSLQLCFLTIPPVSKPVAFSLWFMSQWGSLRCLCDKQGVWQIELWKTSQILAISLHAAFLLPPISVWLWASWEKDSKPLLSIPLLPTPHLSPVWLLCHLCSNSLFLLTAEVPGSQTLPSCSCCALTFAALLFHGCRDVLLCAPPPLHLHLSPASSVCRFKHGCISVSLELLLSVPIQLSCLECSSSIFQQTQGSFTGTHTTEIIVPLWNSGCSGWWNCLPGGSHQGCSELRRWLAACWVCDTQLQSCHPLQILN